MATEENNSRHTQLPACTAKQAFKSTAMCILCVVVCVPAETRREEVKKGSRVCGGTHKKLKCTAEVRGGSKEKTAQTHDCTVAQAAAIHTKII
ncbi:hypothetical protein TCDM_13442 [Trypanosoma cruzi Dm28c]|uniref:Uncharacterized protein n=1 Tax=Trypanosoma cruzi Dm28c TaxID=1416333 RepID=V5CIC9_TRYCR|nr:hypothetical protein TCDM_13442 [Trypanosoma cruzi Dm28c]